MGLFEDVFDIVAANYIPKPNADIYPAMLERFSISADKSALKIWRAISPRRMSWA